MCVWNGSCQNFRFRWSTKSFKGKDWSLWNLSKQMKESTESRTKSSKDGKAWFNRLSANICTIRKLAKQMGGCAVRYIALSFVDERGCIQNSCGHLPLKEYGAPVIKTIDNTPSCWTILLLACIVLIIVLQSWSNTFIRFDSEIKTRKFTYI